MAKDEQRRSNYGDDDVQQTEQSRCPPLEETQPDTETQQQQQHNAVVDAGTEQKKKAAAANADDCNANDADVIDLEAAFPPEHNRVSRVPGAYREGGDNSLPTPHRDQDHYDDAALNSTSRTRRMMQNPQQQTGASPRLTETLVSATLVTEEDTLWTSSGSRHAASAEVSRHLSHQLPTATATAVYGDGIPQLLPGDEHLPSVVPPESTSPLNSRSRSRKTRLVRTACLVGVVALVVGLSISLVTVVSSNSSSSSSSNTAATVVSADAEELDPATTSADATLTQTETSVLVLNDINGTAIDVPEQEVTYFPTPPRQIQYAVTWGTASNCAEIMGNGVTLQLQCGGSQANVDPAIDIGLQLVGAANAVCQRQSATEMTCRLDTSESATSAMNQAAAAAVFTCIAGPAESLEMQLLQLQAIAVVSDTMASQCATVLQQGAVDAITGQQTTFYGGKTVSYASLGRYCRRDSVTEEQAVTGNWQVEAELATCQGQSRTIATNTTISDTDGNDSSLQQDYCYDAATCAVESTCVPATESGDDGDDGDGAEIEDDESSDSSGTVQTVVQDLVCVGSKQCTSLLESVVLTAPEGSSRCAHVVGQQEDVLSVEQLSAMARTELVETRNWFLQQLA